MSLRKKKKSKLSTAASIGEEPAAPGDTSAQLTASLGRIKLRNDSPSSRNSSCSDRSSGAQSLGRKSRHKKSDDIEMGIKNVEVLNESVTIHTVEVLKRPGQTLGFYIREGNGKTMRKGVFISRIAENSIVEQNGLLKVGDEIQAINSVNVTRTNLDDVVVLMSIPKKLILTVKSQRPSVTKPQTYEPLCVPRSHYDDTDSIRNPRLPVDLNTEDSNDSGLSSEHSVRGDRTSDPQPDRNYQTPAEPVYAKPKTSRTELYTSDCEHEYNPTAKLSTRSVGSSARKDISQRHHCRVNTNAYNSDSELLPRNHSNGVMSQQRNWNFNTSAAEHLTHDSKPAGFSPEMQHWLRKFDQTLDGTQSQPTSRLQETDNDELEGYRSELWRQEKLLNDAIYNMESALNVDAMLQQSTPSTTRSPRAALPSSLNSGAASAYSYLRDLPLLIRTPMKVNIEEFRLYRPECERTGVADSMPEGSMRLKIYCGHGLKTSRTSLRDLYCTIQLDNIKQAKTVIRTGAINFDWDETFDMVVSEGVSSLVCMVYHWDAHIRHKLCFTGSIRLANILNKASWGPQNCKCALKLEPRGILYLEVSYCRTQPSREEGTGPVKAFLFGQALKDILSSSQGPGTSVPLIVSKCVEEVENRGLNVTGIYRLCGAAKKKQQLRQEFERHPQLVDLSSSNVPEIHAITGLLKDYLRELPEPLLSSQAYEAAERALTKDTTQDADLDSLEVVNEFVAKLYPWQQGTLIYLLNHLKRVALCQAENKMTTANLAVCFGPIFVPFREPQVDAGAEPNSLRLHIETVKYLLDIWPQNYSTNNSIVI